METYKGLVINYGEGGGLQNGIIAGPKLFAASPRPPSRQVEMSAPPVLKGGNFLRPPSVWLKFQALAEKLPQNLFCLPFSMA